jgi:hypothetical protein
VVCFPESPGIFRHRPVRCPAGLPAAEPQLQFAGAVLQGSRSSAVNAYVSVYKARRGQSPIGRYLRVRSTRTSPGSRDRRDDAGAEDTLEYERLDDHGSRAVPTRCSTTSTSKRTRRNVPILSVWG